MLFFMRYLYFPFQLVLLEYILWVPESLVIRCKFKCKVKDCRREALKWNDFKAVSGTVV